MLRLLIIFLLLGSHVVGAVAKTPVGRVVKALPLFLDQQGQDSLTPSLYERDTCQVQLREHAGRRSALRVELRGIGTNSLPQQITLEQPVTPGFFRKLTSLTLAGDDCRKFGDVTAWRTTLWSGGQKFSEQKSFLW